MLKFLEKKYSYVFLMLLCTVFTAIGQILLKKSTANLSLSFLVLATNYYLILGLLCYGFGLVLLVLALRKGELSVIYPMLAISYVWVSIASPIFLGETMKPHNWLGIAFIFVGVTLIGKGAKK